MSKIIPKTHTLASSKHVPPFATGLNASAHAVPGADGAPNIGQPEVEIEAAPTRSSDPSIENTPTPGTSEMQLYEGNCGDHPHYSDNG